MITNPQHLERFNKRFKQKHGLTHEQALDLMDALWEEYLSLTELSDHDPWEGVETDIKIAKMLQSACSKNSSYE